MFGRTFRIFLLRVRNTTSMGNFMPKVWTPSDGAIHKPSPGSSLVCFNKPVRRVALVLAMPARSARTTPRGLVTLSFSKLQISNLQWKYGEGDVRRGVFLGRGGDFPPPRRSQV